MKVFKADVVVVAFSFLRVRKLEFVEFQNRGGSRESVKGA